MPRLEGLSEHSEDSPLLSSRHLATQDDESNVVFEPNPWQTHDSEFELDLDADFGGKEARAVLERSLLRKLDRRMSILILIYILNYIDRNNAAAARLRGFEEDLHLVGNQFASILSILYVGYIIMQIPSNMLLTYIGKPSLYLPSCMVVWGGISILTGFMNSFFSVLSTRFFLGFVEAAFFPGALFLLSKWYTRKELSQRTALLYSGSLVSNAFGTLIASGILDSMDGILGFAAWRWLFFVEGSLTVFVAICSIFILPDFPETPSGWLTSAERSLALQRMAEETGVGEDLRIFSESESGLRNDEQNIPKHPQDIMQIGLRLALADWKVWWLAVTIGSMAVALSFNAFFPTLSATMGYNETISLLLCSPPWIFATVSALIVSRRSDRMGERYWHIVIPFLFGILGYLLAMSTMNTGLRYFSLFLMAQSYAGYVCFLAWASGSISGPASKRAVGLAVINSGSTVGNIFGSYIWPVSWGPTYFYSYAICILTSFAAMSMCFVFRRRLALLNAEAERTRSGHRYLL